MGIRDLIADQLRTLLQWSPEGDDEARRMAQIRRTGWICARLSTIY